MNTTDISILCREEDERIKAIEKVTGVPLFLMSVSEMCAGPKLIGLSMYGASIKCLSSDQITQLVTAFKGEDWVFPELTSLTIYCENNEQLNKVYTI